MWGFLFQLCDFVFLGLVNGAQGTVVGIIYAPGKRPPELPNCVLVKFDNYLGKSNEKPTSKLRTYSISVKGPSVLGNDDEPMECVVPITPVQRTWFMNKVQSSRMTIPLKPAYAMSIHAGQVMTF